MTNFGHNSVEKYKEAYNNTVDLISSKIINPDYTKAESYLGFVQTLDKIENRPTYILDLFKNDFLFVSEKYLNLLGFDKTTKINFDLFFDSLHPDDRVINLQSPTEYMKLLSYEKPEELKNIKHICDYRLKMKTGEYIRVQEQMIVLEVDLRNTPWLILAICDTSLDQDIKRKSGAVVINMTKQEVLASFGNIKALLPQQLLSKREYEVLKYIAKGYSSKQIANKLFLSINTINNHRRNLIAKTGCSNTFEAIKFLGGI